MRSLFVVLSLHSAVSYASNDAACDADVNSMLQAKSVVRKHTQPDDLPINALPINLEDTLAINPEDMLPSINLGSCDQVCPEGARAFTDLMNHGLQPLEACANREEQCERELLELTCRVLGAIPCFMDHSSQCGSATMDMFGQSQTVPLVMDAAEEAEARRQCEEHSISIVPTDVGGASPMDRTITIGRSRWSASRCVMADQPVLCDSNAGDPEHRLNDDRPEAPDTYDITTNGRQVCAHRTDQNGGWGQRLEIACRIVESSVEQVEIEIGRHRRGRADVKCVDAPVPVNCAPNAGDLGYRLNPHRASDTFHISVRPNPDNGGTEVCAQRTDDGKRRWGMRLRIACDVA